MSPGSYYWHAILTLLAGFTRADEEGASEFMSSSSGLTPLTPVYFWMTYFAVGPIAPLIGNVTQIVLVFQVR